VSQTKLTPHMLYMVLNLACWLSLQACVCAYINIFYVFSQLFGLCFSGKRPLSDVWALDTAAKPYEWRKLEPEGEGPPPCM
jgi:hypothetical protein